MALPPSVLTSVPRPSFYNRMALARFSILLLGILTLTVTLRLAAQDSAAKPASSDAARSATSDVPTGTQLQPAHVLVVVRDKHGKVLSDLAASDFTVEEDGRPVTVSFFKHQSDTPLKLGLLVDTGVNQRSFIDQEKTESKTFIDQLLRENDSAFVLHFDREVELLQDFTSSKPRLETALGQLETESFSSQQQSPDDDDSSGGQYPGRGPARGQGRGMRRSTTLYDAIYLASDELMQKQRERKVLIVLSDGVDRGSKESLESTIEATQRADTIIYAIYLKSEEESGEHHGGFGGPRMGGGMGGPMGGPMGGGGRHGGGGGYPREPRPDGKKILQQISSETGGRFFEVSKKQPLSQIYSSISEDLHNQYVLGLAPGKDDSSGYHKLVIKTKPKDTEVQAREGFYWAQ